MSKIKNFEEFLKEEVFVRPNEPVQQAQPVQDQALQPQPAQPVQPQMAQSTQPMDFSKANKKLDFIYLDKDANIEKVKEICESIKLPENEKYIYGIVVRPEFISETKKYLEDGGDFKIIAAVSYPTGDDKNSEKMKQLQKSISDGADEINVVMDYNKLIGIMSVTEEDKKEDKLKDIQTDIRSLVEYCKERSKIIKIVIEMEALGDETKISKAVEICKEANVDFITTSTGMFNQNTKYSFETKMKDVTDIVIPLIQGMDDININVSGGVNSKDRLLSCLKDSKIQRISTTMSPQNLLKK